MKIANYLIAGAAALMMVSCGGGMSLEEAKEIKKATKLTDKDLYAAFGWLLREDKINMVEEGKEVFVNLI